MRATDAEQIRAMVGAAILWDACTDIAILRKVLTKSTKG